MMTNSAKVVLILLNVFMFLGGGACLVAGLLFKFESGFMSSDVVTLLNKIDYRNLPLGVALEALTYLTIAFGSLVIIMATIGLFAAWKGVKGCLYFYLAMIVFAVVMEAALVGIWITVRGRRNEWLRGNLLIELAAYAGPTSTDEVSKGWNKMFIESHCCGVNDQFKDGGTNSDFTEIPTTWTSATDKVPASCCQGVNTGNVANYVNSASCTNTPSNFYTNGCYDRLNNDLNVNSLIIIGVCAAICLAQVIAFIVGCVEVTGKKGSVSPTHNAWDSAREPGSKPPPYVAVQKFLQNKNRRRE